MSKYEIARSDAGTWARYDGGAACNAALWASSANIGLTSGGASIELWEHSGPGSAERVIDNAVKVAACLGWDSHAALTWTAIFCRLQRLLDEALAAEDPQAMTIPGSPGEGGDQP